MLSCLVACLPMTQLKPTHIVELHLITSVLVCSSLLVCLLPLVHSLSHTHAQTKTHTHHLSVCACTRIHTGNLCVPPFPLTSRKSTHLLAVTLVGTDEKQRRLAGDSEPTFAVIFHHCSASISFALLFSRSWWDSYRAFTGLVRYVAFCPRIQSSHSRRHEHVQKKTHAAHKHTHANAQTQTCTHTRIG